MLSAEQQGMLDVFFRNESMSLFHNFKLKRRIVQGVISEVVSGGNPGVGPQVVSEAVPDPRCTSDGESAVENSSCSPDSGSPGEAPSPSHESSSYPSPELVRHSTGISTHHRLRLLNDSRTAPDSGGYQSYSEMRSMEPKRSNPRVYDGGGDAFVSSTPMMMINSRSSTMDYDDMSTSPPPPDTSDERKVDIQSTVRISHLYAGTDDGCSLGAGGPGHGLIASVGPRHGPPSPPTSMWTNESNASTLMDHREARKHNNIKHKLRVSRPVRTPEGINSVFWSMNNQPNGHPHNSAYSRAPREVLNSPRKYEASDAVRVSVDGLLSLGQDRKSPHQMSPSPSMRSPYPPSPSPSHYGSLVRVSSSGEIHTLSPSPSPSSSSFQYASQPQLSPLNMERLWAGESAQSVRHVPKPELALDLSKTDLWTSNGAVDSSGVPMIEDVEEDDQPMICMICDDKATGLHYGIITCEGCKGFFKRTVQNKRVYQCIADGECEVTKVQRNRCQFCRFKKCLDQGMVLAAVREDRMPGGRNSGAVYNMYKTKYKKKNKNKNVSGRSRVNTPDKSTNLSNGYETSYMINGGSLAPQTNGSHSPISITMSHNMPLPSGGLFNGNILKTALTNPAEVAHLRHRDSLVTSTRCQMSLDVANSFIHRILKVENSSDLSMADGIDRLLEVHYPTIKCKLETISDHVGTKLVEWAKSLPFYHGEEEHAELLTSAWPSLLILAAATHQAMFCQNKLTSQGTSGDVEAECRLEYAKHMYHLHHVECKLRDQSDPVILDEIRLLVEKFSEVVVSLRRLNIQIEEYVCLKVIIFLTGPIKKGDISEFLLIRDQYIECLRYFCESRYPSQINRVEEVLVKHAEITDAASLLVTTKSFYVPIMMCWNRDR